MSKNLQILNVGELIEVLKDFPKNYHVIISRDSEGNEFSPVYRICAEHYDLNFDDLNSDINITENELEPNALFIYPTH